MPVKKKITIDLGGLETHVDAAIEREGITVSQFGRRAIANELKVPVPVVKEGSGTREKAKKANAARWKKHRESKQ